MIIIYPIILVLFLLYGCTITKVDERGNEFLNPRQADMLRAVACLGVILHHLTQIITSYGEINKGPITILSSMGILFTAVFFFFSGYGLLISFMTKENYLDTFLIKRLSTVLIPFFTANTVYVIVKSIENHRIESIGRILSYIFGITLINSNGWYIIEIVVLYLIFYLLFKYLKNMDIALAVLCIFTFALMIFAKQRGHDNLLVNPNYSWFRGEWWYNSTICFVFGLLVARFKKYIIKLYSRTSWVQLAVSGVLFVIVFYFEEKILRQYGYYRESFNINTMSASTITLMWQMALCVLFMWFLINICYHISFANKPMLFIAGISNEIFLLHNIFVRDTIENIKMPDFLRYLMVLIFSVIAGYIMSKVNKPIINAIKKPARQSGSTRSEENITLEREMLIKKKIKRQRYVKATIIVIIGIVMVMVGFAIRRILSAKGQFRDEVRCLAEAKIGDIIYFGYYGVDDIPGDDRLEWIVLNRDDNKAILATKYGISGESYNRQHREVTWEESDLRNRLNEEYLSDIFSDYEKSIVITNECGDYLSLMTAKDVADMFDNDDMRMLYSSDAAKMDNVNVNNLSKANYWDFKEEKTSWWWLRNEAGERKITAPIVNVDGVIEEDKKTVNKPNGAVRPVVIVEIPEMNSNIK